MSQDFLCMVQGSWYAKADQQKPTLFPSFTNSSFIYYLFTALILQ